MAGQNTKIIATDYNTIQKKISAVLGDGGTDPNTDVADSTFGYGQVVLSNQVAVNAKISSNQWANLQTDIIKVRQHQTGNTETLVTATLADSIDESRRAAYNDMADLCITYKSIMPPSSQATRTAYVATYSNLWKGTLTHTVTLNFSSHVRFFFNSGGFFDMYASKTVGTGGAKNNSWTTMLANMGTLRFGRTETTRTAPDGTVTVVSAIGYDNITTTNQLIYQKLTETPTYTPNQYDIYVKQGTSTSQLVLTLVFADLSGQPNPPYGTDEYIDGTVTSTVEMYRSSGSNVSIPSPTVASGIVAT